MTNHVASAFHNDLYDSDLLQLWLKLRWLKALSKDHSHSLKKLALTVGWRRDDNSNLQGHTKTMDWINLLSWRQAGAVGPYWPPVLPTFSALVLLYSPYFFYWCCAFRGKYYQTNMQSLRLGMNRVFECNWIEFSVCKPDSWPSG